MSNRNSLLRRIASAKTFAEKSEAVNALEQYDRNEREAARVAREIDLGDTIVREAFTPVATYETSTVETDWLADFRVEASQKHIAIAEAAQWFERVSPEVKADRTEFGIQAEGFMRREANKYGEQASQVFSEGLAYIGTLYRQSASGLDQIQQTVDPHDNPKQTPLNPEVYDNFAAEVHPINAGVVGTETSERAPMMQMLMQQNGGQASPEVPGGHLEQGELSSPYSSPSPFGNADASTGSLFDSPDAPDAPNGLQSTASGLSDRFLGGYHTGHDDGLHFLQTGENKGSPFEYGTESHKGYSMGRADARGGLDPRFPYPRDEEDNIWHDDDDPNLVMASRVTDMPSLALNSGYNLDDFRREAASGLDQVQQTVDPHENPRPVPLNTEVAFPWMLDEQEEPEEANRREASLKSVEARLVEAELMGDVDRMARQAGLTREAFLPLLMRALPLLMRAAPKLLKAAPMVSGLMGGGDKQQQPAQGQEQEQEQAPATPLDNNTTPAGVTAALVAEGMSHREAGIMGDVMSAVPNVLKAVNPIAAPVVDMMTKNIPGMSPGKNNGTDDSGQQKDGGPLSHLPSSPLPMAGISDLIGGAVNALGKPASLQRQADMYGASDAPHNVPQPNVANNPSTTPNLDAGYAEGRRDATDPSVRPTFADASTAAGESGQYAMGYSDALQQLPGSENDRPGPARPSIPASVEESIRPSAKFVKKATAQTSDYRKGYAYAQKWDKSKPLVRTGSVEFETGLVAGIVDLADGSKRKMWHVAHLRAGGEFAGRAQAQGKYLSYLNKQAGVSSPGLEPTDPRMHASPTGQTPHNGPGTVPLLNGEQDAAAPAGPAPYNGATPFGQSVVPDRMPMPPTPMVNAPGAPQDNHYQASAFRRTVQANLLNNKRKG